MEASNDVVAEEAPSTASEAEQWLALKREGSTSAREALFALHMPLARRIAAKRFFDRKSGDLDLADLRQLAYAGLLEAIDRFDPDRGVPFEGFARRRILGSVVDGLSKMSEVREQISFRNRVRRERLKSLRARDPDLLQGDDALQALIELATGLAVGFMLEDTAGLYVDEQRDQTHTSAYDTLAWRETLTRLMEELVTLPPRERAILRRHYFDGLSFEQIAALLGLSKSRVAQLHKTAIELMRKRLRTPAKFRLEK